MNFGVLILGAGSSRRMGRPKLLLPWGNTSVLGHLLQLWQSIGVRQLTVVVAADVATDVRRWSAPEVTESASSRRQLLLAELDRLHVPARDRIVNPDPDRGMFSSIQCAAQWTGWNGELTHHVIVLGDQPLVKPETLRALLDFAINHPESICQPRFNGHRRHPVVLPKALFRQAGNSGARDLKEFLEPHSAARADFEATDAGLELDLDTPEDYERAKRLWREG